jgi:hypothetical protein
MSSGQARIEVRARNNVYTVLAAVAMVALIIGLTVLFMRANILLGPNGLMK